MESPYNGRATVEEYGNQVRIIIPTRKIYFFLIMFSIWLVPMGIGGAVGFTYMLFSNEVPVPAALIMILVWATFITLVGRGVWWMAFGKEVIDVDEKTMEIARKGLLFSKPKLYNLNECKNFKVVDNSLAHNFPFAMRPTTLNVGDNGTIAFDYGMKTIKFAGAVDEAEGRFLINWLKERSFLTDKNIL